MTVIGIFFGLAFASPAHAASIRYCFPNRPCTEAYEFCRNYSRTKDVPTRLLCIHETLGTVSEAAAYLRKSLDVHFSESVFEGKECDKTYTYSFLNSVMIGASPRCISGYDFLRQVFHEIGHRILSEQLKACPEGTGELTSWLEGVQSPNNHNHVRTLAAATDEVTAFDEGFANFLGKAWASPINESRGGLGVVRTEGLDQRAEAGLDQYGWDQISKNEFLTAAWLKREATQPGGIRRLIQSICPGGYTLKKLKTNLDYSRTPGSKLPAQR